MDQVRKTALVTGASGGIGMATAKLFAQNGYDIIIHYHHHVEKAQKLYDEIITIESEALIVKADLSSEVEVKQMFDQIKSFKGRIDVLVNNAGILDKTSRLDQMNQARLEKIFKTNIVSYFLCSKYAVLQMSTKYNGLGGVIINVSSKASVLGSANEYIDYAASKGAIDTLTKGLAQEVAEEGIRVNGIRPGFIDTAIHLDPNRLEKVKNNIPLKRIGKPLEVADAILFLASNQSSYITGSMIDIAGGR
ncbi:MAG: SDR family oxidoreductase [Gammaproteobacteria bacterium]|nr:MAG: SDR family oxidoreductase [Gammaproteobacteria bacterium]UTW42583.1 SDR family oxidoreductase [bacterium SCSIO 12844]